MLTDEFINRLRKDDFAIAALSNEAFELPAYKPETHYLELTRNNYFKAIVVLRHYLKAASEYFFDVAEGAKNIDLFMLTPSISSPMGPGSDSEGIPIEFGGLSTYLVDSSQFGFEPIVMNGVDKVYCYLPSMRGEDPDERHLNQFFHCEAEINGTLDDIMTMVEGYINTLAQLFLSAENIVDRISTDSQASRIALKKILETKKFPVITFDNAIKKLEENGQKNLVNYTESGRDISSRGELKLVELMNAKTPIWIVGYDRDRVPFYQMPDPKNPERVLNADLIFPPIINGSFGGEIVGCGQRQNRADEMIESITRQHVNQKPYAWYINLRNQPNYSTTAGFGMGVERFITWALCRDDIKDVIMYPRLKGVITYP